MADKFRPTKQFRVADYAYGGAQPGGKNYMTFARKELAAYSFLCRQQEAREWMQELLHEEFPLWTRTPQPDDPPSLQKAYKSDLFPVLRDGIHICKLANAIAGPNTIPKFYPNVGDKPFLMLENINFFLKAGKTTFELPDHKLFLPLDLHERKNMPKVIYCLHELARIAESKYGKIGIKDNSGKYKFDEEELNQAAIDLEELDKAKAGKAAAPVPQVDNKLLEEQKKAEDARHNAEQVENAKKKIELNQLHPYTLVIGGASKAEGVDGVRDDNYCLVAELTFNDGSKKSEKVRFNTGTHDWEREGFSITPEKPVKEVYIYPVFHDHSGRVWFEGFGCFEDRNPGAGRTHFLDNPSFEVQGDTEAKAAHWAPIGNGYKRNSDQYTDSGNYSIEVSTSGAGARNKASVFQNISVPILIEGYSKAENVSGSVGENYAIVLDVAYMDGSTQKDLSIPFSTGTHDWEKKNFLLDPKGKLIKDIDFRVQLKSGGKAWFDHCSVSQEAGKEYVKNSSFEKGSSDEKLADKWTPEGKGYKRNYEKHAVYGGTSIEVENNSESDNSGAFQVIEINQTSPAPLTVEGYSLALGVSGEKNADYSLTVDFEFQDGTKESLVLPFNTGTHDWEKEQAVFKSKKAVKKAEVHCRFKNKKGLAYFDNISITEPYVFGENKLSAIQRALVDYGIDEQSWIQQMKALKQQLIELLRINHLLEKELAIIDKKISLLIKNRVGLEEIVAHSTAVFNLISKKKKEVNDANKCAKIIKANLNTYSQLFYLLQVDPKYLAKLLYLIKPEQMDNVLETVILTLFGDNFSPREEYLLLELIHSAIYEDISAHKDLSGFLENNTVITKVIVTYCRREQGQEYLASILSDLIQETVNQSSQEIIEISPVRLHMLMTGKNASSDEEALQNAEVKRKVQEHISKLLQLADNFLNRIVSTVEQLPYGLKWICKKISEISTAKFPGAKREAVQRVIGYFVYYRFINPAIITPENFGIVSDRLNYQTRQCFYQVAKVLQLLFNFAQFGKAAYQKPINDFIENKKAILNDYFTNLIKVKEPQEALMIDKYTDLTQISRPVILINYDELYHTHELIVQYLDNIAPTSNDKLRQIVKDLQPLPEFDFEDPAHEIKLELVNRWDDTDKLNEEPPILEVTSELAVQLFRVMPVVNYPKDISFFQILDSLTNTNDKRVTDLVTKLRTAITQLQKEKGLDPNGAANLLQEELLNKIQNLASIKERRNNELNRLKIAVKNLEEHRQFQTEQLTSYQKYLNTARERQTVQSKTKKPSKAKKEKKKKFAYSDLKKMGIIVDSTINKQTQKATSFTFSPTDRPGILTVKAKMAGISAASVELVVDELLELQQAGESRMVINDGDLTLDVTKTLDLLNKNFLAK